MDQWNTARVSEVDYNIKIIGAVTDTSQQGLWHTFKFIVHVTWQSIHSFYLHFFHPIEQRPNLCQLISFRVRSGNINLLEQIGTNYWKLGVQLLNDATGAVTKAIVEQYQNDAAKINMEILQRWIQGGGKLPVEWDTLVKVLKDIQLSELANEMEQALKWVKSWNSCSCFDHFVTYRI